MDRHERDAIAILFVIDLAACRGAIIGSGPDSAWVMRCGRHLSEAFDGLLVERVLLHDHDALCTGAVCEAPPATGVRTVRAPPLADVNVHAEQSVRTIKESCVNRLIKGSGSLPARSPCRLNDENSLGKVQNVRGDSSVVFLRFPRSDFGTLATT
jgi:hypothetical protein